MFVGASNVSVCVCNLDENVVIGRPPFNKSRHVGRVLYEMYNIEGPVYHGWSYTVVRIVCGQQRFFLDMAPQPLLCGVLVGDLIKVHAALVSLCHSSVSATDIDDVAAVPVEAPKG